MTSPYGTLPYPASLTGGVSLQVIDINEVELVAIAGADGTATAYGSNVPSDYLQQGQYLRIERAVVTSGSANLCYVTFYQGDQILAQRGRDWTPLPPGDVGVSEYPSYLTILPTSCLTVYITGANEGDLFHITYTYQLVQKIAGSG